MKHTIKLDGGQAVVVENTGTEVALSMVAFGVTLQTKKIDPMAAMALSGALAIAAEQAQSVRAQVEEKLALHGMTKKCARVGMTGHPCGMPAGSKCPDCGPCLVDVGEGS